MSDRATDKTSISDKSAAPATDLSSVDILKESPQATVQAADLLKDFPRVDLARKPFSTMALFEEPRPDAKLLALLRKSMQRFNPPAV